MNRRVRRAGTSLLLVALLAGCAPLPTPLDTMHPVVSPAAWAQGTEPAGLVPTDVQPRLLWRQALPGTPDSLWWNGDTLLASSLAAAALPWQDRYLTAFDAAGQLRWSRDLAPGRLLDAGVDAGGNAYLAVAASSSSGSILSLDPAGVQRWSTPWQSGWPKSLRVSPDGQRTVVGFDGSSGAFPGRLEILGPDGVPLPVEISDRLTGFAGFPSSNGGLILMGYEGAETSLYPNRLFRGIGVRLIRDDGSIIWSIINYHYPLALDAAGDLAVVFGMPSGPPPPQDTEPAPPFGQLLWLDGLGQIVGRYRLSYTAEIRYFGISSNGLASVLAVTSHRATTGASPITQQQVTWHDRTGHVVWQWSWEGDLAGVTLAPNGRSVLVAQRSASQGDWLTLLDDTGKVFWRYHATAAVQAVALSPDGRFAAVLAADGLSYFDTQVK